MPRAAKPAILELTLADSSPLRLTESSNRYYIEIKPIGCERIYRKLPVDVTTAWLLDEALSGRRRRDSAGAAQWTNELLGVLEIRAQHRTEARCLLVCVWFFWL